MFHFFKKKTLLDKLNTEYKKRLEEALVLSTVDRTLGEVCRSRKNI